MARKRNTQPATQLHELNKPTPFVPKLNDVTEVAPITSPGRPSEYNGEETCKLARNMARAGLSHTMMARIFGVAPSTFSLWKAQHPAFLKALERGTEQVDKALETTAIQRALGYSYETEKAFQTGVKMTVVETLPPEPSLLKFMLERRMPGQYRETKEVVHTHNAGQLFRRCWSAWMPTLRVRPLLMLDEVEEVRLSSHDVAPALPIEDEEGK